MHLCSTIQKGIINHFRIETLHDYSKKDYSHVTHNIEGSLFNNKEFQNVLEKSKKVSVTLMIDRVAIEETIALIFQQILIGL